jgi:hypothetical protein
MVVAIANQLSEFLGSTIEELDIPDSQFELAVSRYKALGRFLERYWEADDAGGLIYPQGSMLLGTITRLYHRNDEYDIDLVCRRDLDKASTTQTGLKTEVGDGLELFVEGRPEGTPSLEPGKRCWTLQYLLDHFHMAGGLLISKILGQLRPKRSSGRGGSVPDALGVLTSGPLAGGAAAPRGRGGGQEFGVRLSRPCPHSRRASRRPPPRWPVPRPRRTG